MNGGGRIIQDPLDRVSAATTLGAASEAGIDIAHAGPSRILCDHRPHLMVAEYVTRADNHRFLLTNQSDQDRHKRGAAHSHKHDEVKPRHLGVAKRPLAD